MNINLNNSQSFWDAVANDFYGKRAFSSERLHCAEPLQQHLLFASVVECCQRHLQGEWGAEIHWQKNGKVPEQEITDSAALYPTLKDGDFVGYNQRMTALDVQYTLKIYDIQRVNYNFWRWGCLFLTQLFQRRGMNKLGISTYITVENRQLADEIGFAPECSVHMPIIGAQKHYLWSAEYMQRHPTLKGNSDYQTHIDQAECLVTPKHGFCCIPKKYWYSSQFTTKFNVTLTLSLQEYADITPYIINTLVCPPLNERREPNDHFEYLGLPGERLRHVNLSLNTGNLQSSVEQAPESLLTSFETIHNQVDQDHMYEFWMRISSAYGFNICPEALPVAQRQTPTATSILQVSPQFPLRWRQTSSDVLCIAANGHILKFNTQHVYDSLFQTLNKSEAVTVESLTQELDLTELPIFYDIISQLAAVYAISMTTPA
ncbi:hypothetical protein [Xenorhabdus bovienii]|uniref:hypothetical protein n=1 Tax=Xenorhabdus bovienii TaxID=40576 RepID=UPI0023B27C0B|nr:hypothetical protein [Xenorhabdus bovienii]MDE9467186.1 hypothetical protein [Xenorhabdus bovienii]